jgi:hypothetical protein
MPEAGWSSTIDTTAPHFCIQCKEMRTGQFRGQICNRCYKRQYYQRPEVRERNHEYNISPEVRLRQREYQRKYRKLPKVKEYRYRYKKRPESKLRELIRYEKYYDKPENRARKRLNSKVRQDREVSERAAIANKVLLAKLSGTPLPVVEMTRRERYKRRPVNKYHDSSVYNRFDYLMNKYH